MMTNGRALTGIFLLFMCGAMARPLSAQTESILTLTGHAKGVLIVAFSPDGKRIISGSWDGTVKVWDAENGKELRSLKTSLTDVHGIAFSPDGQRIVTGGGTDRDKPGEVTVWDAGSGKELLSLKGHKNLVVGVRFSPDGKRIISGDNNTLKIWDADNGKEILSREGFPRMAFSPDGKRIISGSEMWDAKNGEKVLCLESGSRGQIVSIAFSADGKRIVGGSVDSFSPSPSWGVVRIQPLVTVWDSENGKKLLVLKGHTRSIESVAFSPDGKRIVSGSGFFREAGEVIVWDAEKGTEIVAFKGHTDGVYTVAFSPDGNRIVSGSLDKTIKIWDVKANK